MPQMSFAAAMRHFFGMREVAPGSGTSKVAQFSAELKALDDADRAYFTEHLKAAGYDITPPAVAA